MSEIGGTGELAIKNEASNPQIERVDWHQSSDVIESTKDTDLVKRLAEKFQLEVYDVIPEGHNYYPAHIDPSKREPIPEDKVPRGCALTQIIRPWGPDGERSLAAFRMSLALEVGKSANARAQAKAAQPTPAKP